MSNPVSRGASLAAAVAMSLGLAACTRSVTIIQPLDGTSAKPVPTFAVKFHPDFNPGTFRANLSGTDITALFQPTPTPGNISTAALTYPPYFMDFDYNTNRQLLIVDGDFTTPTGGLGNRVTRDSSTFSPSPLRIYRGTTSFDATLSLNEGETIVANAYIDKAPKEGLVVTITGHPLVSLNEQPAGASIQVTIQTNNRRATFNVRGIEAGSEIFVLRPIAAGYASAQARGIVKRNQ